VISQSARVSGHPYCYNQRTENKTDRPPVQASIRLARGIDQQIVDVSLLSLGDKHLTDVETLWAAPLQRFKEDDKLWSWRFKQRLTRQNQAIYEGYALEYNNQTQGLMLLERQSRRSRLTPNQLLLYVEAIAAAPWNRRRLTQSPLLLGVGTALLDIARQRSLDLGYQGRLGLQALPRSVGFYERHGMTEIPPDPDQYLDPEELPLTYFEHRAIRP
jgi:GNAT superfamily N-acetyltransferase